jgi:hypothetical protein
MTTRILLKNRIRAEVLKVLSGFCFVERHREIPCIIILSPWISNVQLDIDKEFLKSDKFHFGRDYGIRSINLPYALLLLKVEFGAHIIIVTLPPTERNYNSSLVSYVRNLLDFLDEIGCARELSSKTFTELNFDTKTQKQVKYLPAEKLFAMGVSACRNVFLRVLADKNLCKKVNIHFYDVLF